MAVLILSWIVIAFLAALFAHGLVPGDRAIDVDITVVMGTTFALAGAALANHAWGEPLWGVHAAGFAGLAGGAFFGVAAGVFGQRVRRTA